MSNAVTGHGFLSSRCLLAQHQDLLFFFSVVSYANVHDLHFVKTQYLAVLFRRLFITNTPIFVCNSEAITPKNKDSSLSFLSYKRRWSKAFLCFDLMIQICCFLGARHCFNDMQTLIHLVLKRNLQNGSCYLHLREEKPEARRVQVI